jgi:uncharacterized iron-regulated protein
LIGVQDARYVVLGEKHDTVAVQAAEARIIEALVEARNLQSHFTVGWEFLNVGDQPAISEDFARYGAGILPGDELLRLSQGGTANASYLPVLSTTSLLGGALQGVNLTREEKAPVVQGGIAAADPTLVPSGFALGGADYLERFTSVMEGEAHATPAQIGNYFAAQCLTDDVMADRLVHPESENVRPTSLRFLVTGSFHSEYFEGVVARLKARGAVGLRSIRIFDASDYTASELPSLMNDPKYGPVADYVLFVNEPQAAQSPSDTVTEGTHRLDSQKTD